MTIRSASRRLLWLSFPVRVEKRGGARNVRRGFRLHSRRHADPLHSPYSIFLTLVQLSSVAVIAQVVDKKPFVSSGALSSSS